MGSWALRCFGLWTKCVAVDGRPVQQMCLSTKQQCTTLLGDAVAVLTAVRWCLLNNLSS